MIFVFDDHHAGTKGYHLYFHDSESMAAMLVFEFMSIYYHEKRWYP